MKESRVVSVELHSRYAFQVMQELRLREELCDVVLCIDGAKFKAHKIVLAGCSPYLKAMFTNGMLETEKNCIEIHGIENATMQLLLEFMYSGAIELRVENVQNVLQGASLLGLLSLRNLAAQFLQTQLEPSNCLGIQYFADMYMCGELERSARNFVYQNFCDVIRTDEFLQLSEDRLFALLKSDKLRVTSEHKVLEAALSWIQWDPRNRTDSACQILEHIKLALLEDSYLEDVVLKSEFVRNCAKCQFLISKAILTKQDCMSLSLVTPRPQPPSIYVVGGRNNTHCQLKTMERYDFLQDKWETVAFKMNIARTAVGTTNLDGLLYCVGGECALVDMQEHTLYLRSMEVYDPILRDWIPMPEMKVARSFIAVVAVGRILYAIGGEDRSCSFDLVEKYDPRTKSWSVAPSMRRRRSGAGVALCDNKIYVAGGYDKTLHTDRASVECFDLEVQEWSFVAEMEKARSGLAIVSVDQHLYAFGGRSRHTEQYFNLVERYNTTSQQWTTITSMNTPRAWPGVAKFEGRIYVIGGFDGSNRLRSVEVYDPEVNKWTFISSMVDGRAGCGAAAI